MIYEPQGERTRMLKCVYGSLNTRPSGAY